MKKNKDKNHLTDLESNNEVDKDLNLIMKKLEEPQNKELINKISSKTPLEEIEDSLVLFLNESIKTIQEVRDFNRELREYIKARLPEASLNELNLLLAQSQKYELTQTSTLMTPINTTLATKQTSLISEGIEKNITKISKDLHMEAPSNVSQGLFVLQQFIEIVDKLINNNKNDNSPPIVIENNEKEDKNDNFFDKIKPLSYNKEIDVILNKEENNENNEE